MYISLGTKYPKRCLGANFKRKSQSFNFHLIYLYGVGVEMSKIDESFVEVKYYLFNTAGAKLLKYKITCFCICIVHI